MRRVFQHPMVWMVALLVALIPAGFILAEDEDRQGGRRRQFLPIAASAKPPVAVSCDIPNTNYTSLSVLDPMVVNPETDPDLNLGYRGYEKVSAPLRLVSYASPGPDTKAPQFPGLFGDRRVPTFTNAYQRYRWDANGPTDTYSPWPVTVLGMGVKPGETIYTPDSGYDIGGGYEYIVMYASETRITLHIGREDDFPGYVIHIEDVCTDPDLLALYRRNHAAGRGELPALRGHQPFGKASGNEIKIAVRDTGSFMDPRSRDDWWQGR